MDGTNPENISPPADLAQTPQETWVALKDLVDASKRQEVAVFLDHLGPRETARALSRLDPESQQKLLSLLEPDEAADLIEELPNSQAAELIEELPQEQAAAIVDEMASDQQADILGALSEGNKEAILQEMDPEEAKDARTLLAYSSDTAGGIMITEFLAFPENWLADELLLELRRNAEKYSRYDILYAYIINDEGILTGVVKLRDLVFCPPDTALKTLMVTEPVHSQVDSILEEVEGIFDRFEFFAVPVCDRKGRLVGLVRRGDLREALQKREGRTFLKASGILGGEELRSMPTQSRAFRRLFILSINITLNMISATVISAHQDTLAAAISLAVFLPMISDLSGCSGNQAIAVSIRELALGLVRPYEYAVVLLKECRVGLINGLALGLVLALISYLWKGSAALSFIVGFTLFFNVVFAVCLGSIIPLLLKRFKLDPATASSPILTTSTDFMGFNLSLSLAGWLLPYINVS